MLGLPGADVILYENAIADSGRLFRQLSDDVPWKQESITLFGAARAMPRLTCWMGDAPYVYSGLANDPAPWGEAVREIREIAERLCGETFNGVLLNLYRDGRDSMGWHADDETALGTTPVITSVSLGAVRRFRFKPKRKGVGESHGFDLPDGSILVMRGETQRHWLHAIPKTARPVGPRINLTFRRILEEV